MARRDLIGGETKSSRRDLVGGSSSRRRDLIGETSSEEVRDESSSEEELADLDYLPDGMPRPENGANVAWLSAAFGMTRRTVLARLAGVKPLRYGARHAPIYAFADAAPRLITNTFSVQDIEDAIKRMRPQDMPPMLQAVFWDGQNKKAVWQRNAKQLWHTDDVLEVLADTFKTIRQTMQLWTDTIERAEKLNDQQTAFLRAQVDALQDEIYQRLVKSASRNSTYPLSETPIDAE